jgi:hypothetical protein
MLNKAISGPMNDQGNRPTKYVRRELRQNPTINHGVGNQRNKKHRICRPRWNNLNGEFQEESQLLEPDRRGG